MRSSCSVTSWGVPNVVTVVKNVDRSPSFSTIMSTVGPDGSSAVAARQFGGVAGIVSSEANSVQR